MTVSNYVSYLIYSNIPGTRYYASHYTTVVGRIRHRDSLPHWSAVTMSWSSPEPHATNSNAFSGFSFANFALKDCVGKLHRITELFTRGSFFFFARGATTHVTVSLKMQPRIWPKYKRKIRTRNKFRAWRPGQTRFETSGKRSDRKSKNWPPKSELCVSRRNLLPGTLYWGSCSRNISWCITN